MEKIFIDLETTGLSPNTDQVVSIGMVTKQGTYFYQEFSIDVWCIPDEMALQVNGFTLDELYDLNKPVFVEYKDEISKWIKEQGNKVQFAAWNAGFDRSFYDAYLPHPANAHYNWLDVASACQLVVGEYMSLHKACKTLEITPEPAIHNALNGATKCMEVWQSLQR